MYITSVTLCCQLVANLKCLDFEERPLLELPTLFMPLLSAYFINKAKVISFIKIFIMDFLYKISALEDVRRLTPMHYSTLCTAHFADWIE